MWLWENELRQAGFRRRSEHYWRCERGFDLPPGAYVSIFPGGQLVPPGARGRHTLVEVNAFHVTFPIGLDNLHFYYHEAGEGVCEPGGHTSAAEIRRYGIEPRHLREQADRVGAEVATALQCVFVPRE
jgi:hypothetical protein